MPIDLPILMYLAGWLEGEGCFTGAMPRHRQTLSISAGSTDLDVIVRIAEILEVNVLGPYNLKAPSNIGKERKAFYRIVVNGRKARDVMLQIRPYMGERRRKRIDEIIAFYDRQPHRS